MRRKTLEETRIEFDKLQAKYEELIRKGILPDPKRRSLWDSEWSCPATPYFDPHEEARCGGGYC